MITTAIFDIGKTNKKLFLFDQNFREVFREYSHFEEVKDEDGFPCDNLSAIQTWITENIRSILHNEEFDVKAINFSTYGASFVHIDREGQPVAPLYNYLKPYPKEILRDFYQKYGEEMAFAKETASPQLGMLNSGLQLYWLKYAKPEIFRNIHWSLHFPQYISYLFTGIPVSEYTSIGCHTCLWDYAKRDYHPWVYKEGIDRILPPIVDTRTSIYKDFEGKKLRIGTGIHDSSSALIPYMRVDKKPFLLISTGTWSISLNPFNHDILSDEDLHNDCLNFMRIDGKAVRASRLFLGNEYKLQTDILRKHFGKEGKYHRTVTFDEGVYASLKAHYRRVFHFESIHLEREQPMQTDLSQFRSFEEAFHQLMMELVEMQIASAQRAIGHTPVNKIYVDGGFADNDIYIRLISYHFREQKLRTTQSPLGSALGAAIVISDEKIRKKFLKKHYALKKHPAPL